MADTDFGAFTDRAYVNSTDVLVALDVGGGGVNLPGHAFLARGADGHYNVYRSESGQTATYITSQADSSNLTLRAGSTVGFFSAVEAIGYDGSGLTPRVNFWTSGYARVRVDADGHLFAIDDNSKTLGAASNRWSVIYSGTGSINTSDKREKQQIGAIPDEWLDIWTGVQWCRFKFNDAVNEKGNNARWHFGLIAQDVYQAFAEAGFDGFALGFICLDEWDEQTEPVMKEIKKSRKVPKIAMLPLDLPDHPGAIIPQQVEIDEEYTEQVPTGAQRVVREAGNRWGVRYDLAQAIEAAWQRRRGDRLEATIAALVERMDALEAGECPSTGPPR